MEFLFCSCAGVASGHVNIAGDGSKLCMGEVEAQTVKDITWDTQDNARGGEGFHMAYTWHCVRIERLVEFGLSPSLERLKRGVVWGCCFLGLVCFLCD